MSTPEDMKEQGVALFRQHDYEAAARAFQQAHDAYLEEGQTLAAAEMNVNIGLVHRELGEAQQALELMQAALRVFEDENDTLRKAQVLGNLGGVYAALDDRDKAERSYREAAELFTELGETELYSDTMIALGAMQVRGGKLIRGAAAYQVALENREHLTGPQRIIKGLSNIISRFNRN